MGAISFDDVYADAYVRESVDVVAKKLLRQFPDLKIFQEDIKQDLWIYIFKAIKRYNPARGCSLQTFFRNLIDIRTIDICRHYLNQDVRHQSLEDMDEKNIPVFTCDTIRLLSLSIDTAVIMQRLTPDQHQVCRWIMEGLSLRAIARKLGISDSNFFFLYIKPIRDEFRKEKMQEYLRFY